MIVLRLTDLDENELVTEIVDYLLIPLVVPPFHSVVELSAGGYNPKRRIRPRDLLHLLNPRLLEIRNMDVSFVRNVKA